MTRTTSSELKKKESVSLVILKSPCPVRGTVNGRCILAPPVVGQQTPEEDNAKSLEIAAPCEGGDLKIDGHYMTCQNHGTSDR